MQYTGFHSGLFIFDNTLFDRKKDHHGKEYKQPDHRNNNILRKVWNCILISRAGSNKAVLHCAVLVHSDHDLQVFRICITVIADKLTEFCFRNLRIRFIAQILRIIKKIPVALFFQSRL